MRVPAQDCGRAGVRVVDCIVMRACVHRHACMCDRDPLLVAEYACTSEMLPNFVSVGARVPKDDYRRGLRPGAQSLFLVLTVDPSSWCTSSTPLPSVVGTL